jgi:hypothetical protein
MAISNFIPTLWSASILEAFKTSQAIIPVLNKQYEGEISTGNVVKITGITTPSVQDYSGNSRVLTIDALSDSTQSLSINQEKAISFKVDDVDRVQGAGSFEPVTMDAGRALAEDAEAYVIAQLKSGGTSAGTGAITTAAHAYAAVVAIRQALTKAKVPASQRYLAVSPEFASLLLAEGSKLTSADVTTAGELRNGVLGNLLGFTVIEHPLLSHVVSSAVKPAAIGFHGPSVAYVGQIAKTEAGRMELAFADYIRSLNVYGSKVLRATAVQTYLPAS